MEFDIDRPKEALEIKIQLRANRFWINSTDIIHMPMPRVTSGPGDGTKGESFEIHQFSHATLFRAFWQEGDHTSSHTMPFPLSNLTLQVREGRALDPKLSYEIIIYRSNHLIAQCSWRLDDEAFVVGTNATQAREVVPRPWNCELCVFSRMVVKWAVVVVFGTDAAESVPLHYVSLRSVRNEIK